MTKRSIFGPVLSRRLGYSLGIDMVPVKTCNLDCLYCEVCPTSRHMEDRDQFLNVEDVIAEIQTQDADFDYLTLTGSGEPTLHCDLDKFIAELRRAFRKPLVLITNSLLFRDADVRRECQGFDLVMPSLDAVSQSVFEAINRPLPGIRIEDVIEGLVKFAAEFSGIIWLEILLAKGLNDSSAELRRLAAAAERIAPQKIQLNTVVRPPAYKQAIQGLSYQELTEAAKFFHPEQTEILLSAERSLRNLPALTEDRLVQFLARRPAPFHELMQCFKTSPQELRTILGKLEKSGQLVRITNEHQLFFKAK